MTGHLITLGVLLVAGGIGFGVLRQTVKQMPEQIRLETEIAILKERGEHLTKYVHEEKEISTVRPAPPAVQALPPGS